MNHTIRMMTSQDLDEVVAIELLCSLDPWSRMIFENCLNRHFCVVITREHRVIGFAVLMFVSLECHLLNITVTPDWQHHGYGKILLEHLLSLAKMNRCTEFLLEVRCSNEPALALYRKFGFVKIGDRKEYYATPAGREDAYVMMLQFKSINPESQ